MSDRLLPFLLGITLFIAAGCSGMRTTSSDTSDSSADFERSVAPFAVYDTTGAEVEHPFSGGSTPGVRSLWISTLMAMRICFYRRALTS
ncbi:MAG: hypothetical protein U5J63_02930 [Fodinibius sp.]|nr:hypothetical protein [Fodinibius sp.]